jgi:hypothetical protein
MKSRPSSSQEVSFAFGKDRIGKPDYDYSKELEVRIYELQDGEHVEAVIPSGEGIIKAATVRASRYGTDVAVEVADGAISGAWVASWICQGTALKRVTGAEFSGEGNAVTVPSGTTRIVLHLG